MADSYATEFARKGGHARAQKLTVEERIESARRAAQARWSKATRDALLKDIAEGSRAAEPVSVPDPMPAIGKR